MNFKEQYKSPKWQKKRLEVLEASEYTCQKCFNSDDQLHVHHRRYVKDRDVWDYDTSELDVLCESCHKEIHSDKAMFDSLLSKVDPQGRVEIYGIITGYCGTVGSPAYVCAKAETEYFCGHSVLVGCIAAFLSELNECELVDISKSLVKIRNSGRRHSINVTENKNA